MAKHRSMDKRDFRDTRDSHDTRDSCDPRSALDSRGMLWIEAGETHEGFVADVAVLIPTKRTYTYSVPESLEGHLTIGQRVKVPLGKRASLIEGYVVALDRKTWTSTLRPIHSVLESHSFLSDELVELGQQIAKYYACPLGLTLKAMVPSAVREQRGFKTVRYAKLAMSRSSIEAQGRRLSVGRQRLIDVLEDATDWMQVTALLKQADSSNAVLRAMVEAGWIEISTRKELADDWQPTVEIEEPSYSLTDEQQAALAQINTRLDAGSFSATLLFGVSGSGKTEVYIRAAQPIIEQGGQVILLVPEIMLTTQLVKRLASRLPDIAVVHSSQTGSQRSAIWQRISTGEKKVIVGTRSAVFAPCPKLGLICIDEEQESSFKNLQTPRFHVRDVALMRAKQLGVPVVLGSATPSLEVWHNTQSRADYHRVDIRRRVKELPLPKIHLVDMRDEWAEVKHATILSRTMKKWLSQTLERKEQAILLINRRGFANKLFCPECRSRVTCEHCNVGLVVHTFSGRSRCHYCHTNVSTPTHCVKLGCGALLQQWGLGTQRVEQSVGLQFPDAKLARVDSDTMKHRREYERVVQAFENRELDVLIGTQMIAKGLDFPGVSFVGVVDADPAAVAMDFRAEERLFQLITQVAGRAGRADVAGKVVVQTSVPDLPSIKHAMTHDYESFAVEELKHRLRAGLPPYRRLTRLVCRHRREETARALAQQLVDWLRLGVKQRAIKFAEILGPNPATLARLRNLYRYELLLTTASSTDMHTLLDSLDDKQGPKPKSDAVMIDVGPVSFM